MEHFQRTPFWHVLAFQTFLELFRSCSEKDSITDFLGKHQKRNKHKLTPDTEVAPEFILLPLFHQCTQDTSVPVEAWISAKGSSASVKEAQL